MSERIYKRGRIWWGSYYQDGKRKLASTRCRDKQAAEAVVREWERRAADPDYAAAHTTTLREALGRLLIDRTNKGRAEATINCYRSKAGHLFRLFGPETMLAGVNARRVDDYISTRLGEGAARHTVHKELVTLRGTLKVAKRRGEFTGDIDAVMPDGFSSGYKPRERMLTPDEAQRLLAELPADRAAHMAFVIATGARRSEAERATPGDIDWARGIVRLRGTKTSLADRAVPIAGFSIELLKYSERHAVGTDGKLFRRWGNCHRDLKKARARAELSGGKLQIDGAQQSLDTLSACEKSALLKRIEISPNDLRRTYATWLREHGIEPHLLAPALGHRDSRMVERVYARLGPEALGAIFRERLDHTAGVTLDERPAHHQAGSQRRPLTRPLELRLPPIESIVHLRP